MNTSIKLKVIGISLMILMIGVALFPAISGNAGIITVFSDDTETGTSTGDDAEQGAEPGVEQGQIISIEITVPGAPFLEPTTYEQLEIVIKVEDQLGRPVPSAEIHIYRDGESAPIESDYTNSEGIYQWVVNNGIVSEDTDFRIEAIKAVGDDAFSDEVTIEIKNLRLDLTVSVDPVDEGEEFTCTVVDTNGNPVPLIRVEIVETGVHKYTNSAGETSPFTAPTVNYNKQYMIKASAPLRGYDDGHYYITVINTNNATPVIIKGEIRNYTFVPLQNVEITITTSFETYEGNTDATGHYEISVIPDEDGEYVTIEAYHPENTIQYPESVEVWIGGTESGPVTVNFWLISPEEAAGSQGAQSQPGGQPSEPLNE